MNFLVHCLLPLLRGGNAQMLRSMRLTAALLLVTALHVSAAGYSQRVTLTMHDEPLEKVITEIGRQANVEILFNNDLIRKAGKVTIVVKDADVDEALSMALSSTNFSFKFVEGMLIISPRESRSLIKAPAVVVMLPPGEVKGTVTGPDGKPIPNASVVNKTQKKGTRLMPPALLRFSPTKKICWKFPA